MPFHIKDQTSLCIMVIKISANIPSEHIPAVGYSLIQRAIVPAPLHVLEWESAKFFFYNTSLAYVV